MIDPGESVICDATGVAPAVQYTNTGFVSAVPPLGQILDAADASHYFGADLHLTIEKSTNGEDADQAAGPLILAGQPVSWTYVVTNKSSVRLDNLNVSDDQAVSVNCSKTALDPGEGMTCSVEGTAVPGQYAITGTASGQPPGGLSPVEAEDDSHYFGVAPAVSIEKYTNGEDADTAPGPTIIEGNPVNWEYIVINTGDVPLVSVGVIDYQDVNVSCPQSMLDPGESMTCAASAVAVVGPYANVGTATGTPPVGDPVGAEDPSHYPGEVGTFYVFIPIVIGD